MIKFFRKIRQKILTENKFSKYLIYAIGEILLVMIGILLALEVNNWNENQKDREQEQIYLNRLLEELPDERGWNSAIKITESRTRDAKVNLERIFSQNVRDTALFVNRAFDIGSAFLRNPYIPVYDELVSSGKLSILENDTLRTDRRKYVEIFKWWEKSGAYMEWQSVFKDYNDHMHIYLSPLIENEIQMSSNAIISVEKLRLLGFDLDGYLTDKRSIYHLRKIATTHEQLNTMYKLIQENRLLPLIERVKREVSE